MTLEDRIEAVLRVISKAPVRIALSVGFVALVVGGALYSLVEDNTSLIDGWYWATVVMPTVGFGDFSPATIAGRWIYIIVVACGWFTTLVLGGALAGAIVQSRIEAHTDTPELDDDLDALKDEFCQRIDAIKAITQHPEVIETLRRIHTQTKEAAS